MIITPEYLKNGDRIALVAPAGKISGETVDPAVKMLETWGLEVVPGIHLYDGDHQFAAGDNARLEDLQRALDDPSIKAVVCARGGYGTVRIIDWIDFDRFRKSPKWIIGFSDITVLHAHIHERYGIETIHGAMASGIGIPGPSSDTLRQILFGEKLRHDFPTHPMSRQGVAKGPLVGGNLAILCSLLGSPSEPNTRGKILFIEEVGEHLYRIDRMMWSLKRSGKLDGLKGLIAGGMTEIKDTPDDFGKNANEIIFEHVKEYGYPVCFDFPAGHQPVNRALVFGRNVTLNIDAQSSLSF